MKKRVVIILASGSGQRFGSVLPKQYCNFAGRPLLMRTIDCFTPIIPIEDILVVVDSAMDNEWLSLCNNYNYTSPRTTHGGSSRTESLAKALNALSDYPADTIVMIQDGARPLASENLIRRMTDIPDGYIGAVPAVAVTDTLRHLDKANATSRTVDRSEYVAVQTPQTFTLGVLRESFANYSQHTATDDATLVQQITGGEIALIEGEYSNIKVTNPTDLAIAEALLNAKLQK